MRRSAMVLLFALIAAGCVSTGTRRSLDNARAAHYAGHSLRAAHLLGGRPPDHDRALFLMERGTFRTAANQPHAAVADFIDAQEHQQDLRAIRVSESVQAQILDDRVREYEGLPGECAMLHTLTAINHLQLHHAEHAAVEARRLIYYAKEHPEATIPAISDLLAGLGLYLMNDHDNAGRLFRQAGVDQPLYNERWLLVALDQVGNPYQNQLPRIAPALTLYEGANSIASARLISDLCDDLSDEAETRWQQREEARQQRIEDKRESVRELRAEGNLAQAAVTEELLLGEWEQPDERAWECLPRWYYLIRVEGTGPTGPLTLERNDTGQRLPVQAKPLSGNGGNFYAVVWP